MIKVHRGDGSVTIIEPSKDSALNERRRDSFNRLAGTISVEFKQDIDAYLAKSCEYKNIYLDRKAEPMPEMDLFTFYMYLFFPILFFL